MVFFQVVLLAGYAYADSCHAACRRARRPRCTACCCWRAWRPADPRREPLEAGRRPSEPTLRILGLLARDDRPALFPAVDHRAAGAGVAGARAMGRACLPLFLAVEPRLAARVARLPGAARAAHGAARSRRWAGRRPMACSCCCASAAAGSRMRLATAAAAGSQHARRRRRPATAAAGPATQLLWLVLPALGSWLLLAVTNQLTQHVASIPFLWILPLTRLSADLHPVLRERPLVPARAVPAARRAGVGAVALRTERRHRLGGPHRRAAVFVGAVRAVHGSARRDRPIAAGARAPDALLPDAVGSAARSAASASGWSRRCCCRPTTSSASACC